jgi:hypothetical protein
MTSTTMTLACPVCHTADALTCRVVHAGEGLWVSLRTQRCTCDVYAVWEEVSWTVRQHVSDHDRKDNEH